MNIYYALRHGQSEANKQRIIVSHPLNGIREFGLTKTGRIQVAKSCKKTPIVTPVIVSSDFKRAVETAAIASKQYLTNFHTSPLLRERNFGAFELQPDSNYQAVWHRDSAEDPYPGVETVDAVAARCTELIMQLERQYQGQNVIVVSHGDTLQIMQCVLQGLSPKDHRTLQPIAPGELRVMSAAKE